MEEQYVPEENQLTEAEMLRQRNVANNANAVRNVAKVAANSANPYAKVAGKAVQGLDKLTGGKSSENLGKVLNAANKITPGGMLAQKAINKMGESGTSSRISSALSKKNNPTPVSGKPGTKNESAKAPGKSNSFFDRKEVEEQSSDGGGTSFKATVKFLKTALIAFVPVMVVVVFMNLIVSASQTYLGVIGLDQADKILPADADKKILENGSENLDKELNDDNVGEGLTGYVDTFIDDEYSFRYKKLQKTNFIANETTYSDSDISKLKDFYSGINSYEGHNMDTVYKFFFKLYYINQQYKAYIEELDTPLIMSILSLQSEDKNEIFISNIKDYKLSKKQNNPDFDFYKDWSSYQPSKTESSHDIEVLVQGMIKKTSDSGCYGTKDGGCYSLVSDSEYKEFLRGFLSKKYNTTSENADNLIVQVYDQKQQYEDLMGGKKKKPSIIKTNNKLFWWPIGSLETEEINGVLYAKGEPASILITSSFGDQESFRASKHGGIDIGHGGYGAGVVNVIAAKAGEVIYPTSKSQTQFADNGYYGNPDGGGYGNYVKIKHSDGSYTIYAHLAQNSITVMAGDVVDQGQVIGKLGHSGSSTGPHLHFEVRIGSDTHAGRVFPLDHVDPNNPRPMSYGSGNNFSLTTTILSKEEFVARMMDYYERTKKEGFYKNFALNAEEVYDASLANNVNPELVVVTAGTEQSWTLSSACQYTNNYWGIGITNGKGCNSGGIYDSLSEGIAAYANVLNSYGEHGKYAESIKNRYEDRNAAGCDPSGHGMPGTLEGMQSLYSWVGNYRFNPGSWGSGGCKYFNLIYGENYCSTVPTCATEVATNNCPEESKTTVCEQNDYTAFQLREKIKMRYDIFGL